MSQLLSDVNGSNDLANLTDSSQISAVFGKYSQTFKDGNASLEAYKQELIKLKNDASNLQSPVGLESFKSDYINNIDTEIKSLDTIKGYIDTYSSIFDSIKDAFKSLDMEHSATEIYGIRKFQR